MSAYGFEIISWHKITIKNFIYHRYIPNLARKIIAEKYCSMKKSAYICHRLQTIGVLFSTKDHALVGHQVLQASRGAW